MLKMLQNNAGRNRETSTPVWSNGIILTTEYAQFLASLVDSAKISCDFMVYVWRNYEHEPELPLQQVNIALQRAQNRGVRVRILADKESYIAQQLRRTFNIKYTDIHITQHAKGALIDRKHLLIGSHNLTKNATTKNNELTVYTDIREMCDRYEKHFDSIWAR